VAPPTALAAVKMAAHQNRPLAREVLKPLTRTIFDSFGLLLELSVTNAIRVHQPKLPTRVISREA
jgi:hypothetical protein